MRNFWAYGGVTAALAISIAGCPASEKAADDAPATSTAGCSAGKAIACQCDDGRMLMTTCTSDRRAAACPCFGNSDPETAHKNDSLKKAEEDVPVAVPMDTGTGGTDMMTGVAGTGPGAGGAPPMMGSGGVGAGSGGDSAMSGTGGGNGGMPTGTAEVEALRQVCVDTINMYRATVNVMPVLAPLARGTPDDETCSDNGAKIDGDSGQAHKSAGMCTGYGGQDACPGWPVGTRGYATLEAALKDCLQQMWDEGEPPNGRAACTMDISGCFQKHGHYLNMSDPGYIGVVCGFYLMNDGVSWWMNQDFKSKPWGAP